MPRCGSSSRRASSTHSRPSSSVKTTGSAVRPIGASYPAVFVARKGNLRIAATKASTSSSVVSQEHIQRTSPVCSSQT